MTSEREIALDLLNRLLAGERGCVPQQLGMLLEKSLRSLHGQDWRSHYAWALKGELLEIQLTKETIEEVVAAICADIARNPDEALISVVSWTGSKLAIRTIASVLANPPRPLTLEESTDAVCVLSKHLMFCLKDDPDLLSKSDLDRLIQVLKELQMVEDGARQTADLYRLRHFVDPLVARLTYDPKRVGREKVAGARAAGGLLRRLLAGERGDVPMHLASLLEKSSPGANTAYHYRRVLPPELAELRLSEKTADRILATLAGEFDRNPEEVYLFVLSRPLSETAIKSVARILANPPRALSLAELEDVLDRMSFVLPFSLAAFPEMLSAEEKDLLVQLLKRLSAPVGDVPDGNQREQDSARVRRLAGEMLNFVDGRGIA